MIRPAIRSADRWGDGAYGAPRGDRTHKGVDLAVWPGSTVLSVSHGTVTKIGYPYSEPERRRYRYVEVTLDGNRFRYFYVYPCVTLGQEVVPGTPLGISQPLGRIYPGITEHIHFEVIEPDGSHTDPRRYL